MGYIRHHAIVVTSYSQELIMQAHAKAKTLFPVSTSEIMITPINGYKTFFIGPDGSKEWWEDSDNSDKKRAIFVKWIHSKAHEDGSNSLSFCEFFYGGDDGKAQIENHN